MELSIDTSTRYALVGLSRQGETVAEIAWRSERNHSVELVPTIRTLMDRGGTGMQELEAIYVAKGPGAFSALRVGLSTAKSLAVALDIPLVSIGTLDVEARPFRGLGTPVRALLDAGRDRLYVGSYQAASENGDPFYAVQSPEELANSVDATTLFCGEGVRGVADFLRSSIGKRAVVADVAPPTRRASLLAELAHRRWQEVGADDPATLQPMYLRGSQVDVARHTWTGTQ